MGQGWSFGEDQVSPADNQPASAEPPNAQRRKRRHESDGDPEEVSEWDTPKKKRVKSTSRYIYDALFCEGRDSDVTIVALGQEWHLHRFYLCQAEYFSSMFNGQWSEADSNRIEIDIVDSNIDKEALRILFGSLYSGDVQLSPSQVVPVVAAARWFHFEGLLQQCIEVFTETLSAETLCTYYTAADMYNLTEVKEKCLMWLHFHLLTTQSTSFLKEFPPHLMEQTLSSPDLFVLQVEMDIYTLLKQWLYLQFHPNFDEPFDKVLSTADDYFRTQGQMSDQAFLERDLAEPYVESFRSIHLQHILNDANGCLSLERDRLLPVAWISSAYRQQWLKVVRLEQGKDPGPGKMSTDQFYREAMRCGRTVVVPHDRDGLCWRWVGHSFGVDMVLHYHAGKLTVCRNKDTYPRNHKAIHLQTERREVFLRVAAACLDDKGLPTVHVKSGPTEYRLALDEEVEVLRISQKINYPLYLSLHVAFVGTLPSS